MANEQIGRFEVNSISQVASVCAEELGVPESASALEAFILKARQLEGVHGLALAVSGRASLRTFPFFRIDPTSGESRRVFRAMKSLYRIVSNELSSSVASVNMAFVNAESQDEVEAAISALKTECSVKEDTTLFFFVKPSA